MSRWARVKANHSLGGYDVYAATGPLEDPSWPEIAFADVLRLAFKDQCIETLEHPVVRRLRGEL